jgi:cyclophilin family peptidyl-prolyl cis-trans isomerase
MMRKISGFEIILSALFVIILIAGCSKKNTDSKLSGDVKNEISGGGNKMADAKNPQVIIKTSVGDIKLELYQDKAPVTVENFLKYVDSNFYDGTIFHRVISNFMVQGGGFLPGMSQKKTMQPIKNEANNGLLNDRGTIAMARTQIVDSATAQFFINVVDNRALNHRDESMRGFGYCVFGRVIEGMDTVDKIKDVPTKFAGPYQDVPSQDVVIIYAKKVGN